MSNQDLILYTYNAGRAAVEAGDSIDGRPIENADFSPVVDGRQGEILLATEDLGTANFHVNVPMEQNALSDAVDTVIVSGHNAIGAEILVRGRPSLTTFVSDTVTEENRSTIFRTLSVAIEPTDDDLRVIFESNGPQDGVSVELSEIFVTTAHTIKRPLPGWDHGTRQAQQRFESQSGVSSTWLLGRARQLYRFTWDHLTGADLTILENLRPQSNDFTEPFWLQPPDDSFPLVMVEIDRDSDWQQMFEAPLASGLGHRVTLPLIEVAA